ncbi:hypothetical protein D3C81_1656470 [compost metagenome]
MDRPQHRAGHIVGIDLVATHHQQGRALRGGMRGGEQAVDAQQPLGHRMMGFATGAMEDLVDTRAQDEVGRLRAVVQQVRRPLGHAFVFAGGVLDQQVVVDLYIAGQRCFQRQVDQVHEGMTPHGNDLAVLPGQRVIDALPVGFIVGEGQAQGQ